MAAVVIIRHRRNETATTEEPEEDDIFVQTLPPLETREVDAVMGTLLLG